MFSAEGSNAAERAKRFVAIGRGWVQYRGFWRSHAPSRLSKLVYLVEIQSVALSGLESYVLKQVDFKVLDRKMSGFLRSMLLGKVHWQEGGHARQLIWAAVWTVWKIAFERVGVASQKVAMVAKHGGA
eukprot:11161358-Lingulodinium_polyedra.AAC.1